MFQQRIHQIAVDTSGPKLYAITKHVEKWIEKQGLQTGILTLFLQHTSASLLIQENADPDVLRDLKDFFARLVPEHHPYRHDAEGPDDMPAHIRTALTQIQLSIPVQEGRLALGVWQGIYIFEHRHEPQRRHLVLHLLGE